MAIRPWSLIFSEEIVADLGHIDAKHHSLIRSEIALRLAHEPFVETRNRKPRQPNLRAREIRELRFGPNNRFRVIYQPDVTEPRAVRIIAIGVKQGNTLIVRGQKFTGAERQEEES